MGFSVGIKQNKESSVEIYFPAKTHFVREYIVIFLKKVNALRASISIQDII